MASNSQSTSTISPELVEAHLQQLLTSAQFAHGRRCPTFLKYVVERTLEGRAEYLKERTIGIEAFGRSPEYDMNLDPIVRVTAGEVRKRLSQYYYETASQTGLRIELRSGTYVPDFKFIASPDMEYRDSLACESSQIPENGAEVASARIEPIAHSFLRPLTIWIASGCALAIIIAIAVSTWLRADSAFDTFWKPVVKSANPILICIGSLGLPNIQQSANLPPRESTVTEHPRSTDPLATTDVAAMSGIQRVLFANSKQANIQSSPITTFSDLQKGPVVLIAGLDNSWTMRLSAGLRYHFVQTSPDVIDIQDRTDPEHKHWSVNIRAPFVGINHDYGLVARFYDSTIDQTVVLAAGIAENGTLAASEFLSDRKYLESAQHDGILPRHYKNMEAVIETETIEGRGGPPRILAVYTW